MSLLYICTLHIGWAEIKEYCIVLYIDIEDMSIFSKKNVNNLECSVHCTRAGVNSVFAIQFQFR